MIPQTSETPTRQPTKCTTFRRYLLTVIALSLLLELVIESLCRHSLFAGLGLVIHSPLVFLYNSCIILVSLCLSAFFRRKGAAIAILSTVWCVLGLADCILTTFRTTPLSAIDFALLKSVWSILQIYLNLWQIILLIIAFLALVTGLVFFCIHARKTTVYPYRAIFSLCLFSILLTGSTLLLLQTGTLSNKFSNLANAYRDYGFPYCFCRSLVDRGIDEPEDYSPSHVQQILEDINADSESNPTMLPNIIFVQLESFFDPNYVKKLSFSENPVPCFTALKQSCPHGFLTVPVFGAGTANTEFEMITGMSLEYFGTGEYPYETILKQTACESICYDLQPLGYNCHAIHNNDATFYDRHLVYANLGFNTFTAEEYMQNVQTNPLGWVKDSVLIQPIEDALASTPQQDLIYTVSVQAHGKYPRESLGDDEPITVSGIDDEKTATAFSYYINQLSESDAFVGQLVETLQDYPEPVVVVFFGDHLPNFEMENSDLENGNLFQTEYVIWSNFPLEADNTDLYAYQLAAHVFDLFDIDSGLLPKLHQCFSKDPDYLHALELFEYDMLYGNHDTTGGNVRYHTIPMQMGVLPIQVSAFSHIGNTMYVYGDNFTPYSVVNINDDAQDTTYVSASCLQIDAVPMNVGDKVTVSQVGDDSTVLSTTPIHYAAAEEVALGVAKN